MFGRIVRLVAFVAACLLAVPAVAQFGGNTGGIDGKVTDEQGGVLPGVSVTVTGLGAPQTVYSDARGEFHIINLAPGNYTLTLALQGFSTVNRENVTVALGRNTELSVGMKLSSVAATVTVSGEVPVISTKKVETGAAITQEELKSIPTARDPWVILQSTPGVQVDRINVAGSESGQQSNFSGKGSTMGTFAVDGVNLTDMAALGASAGYYDFDSFQEIQVISGGADASISGSGTHLNMVTKRGTNEVHGNARIFAVDQHFQSNNLPDEARTQVFGPGGGPNGEEPGSPAALAAGNHINSVQDYGADVGGPVWKDHMWLWGAYGRDQINLVTAAGTNDNTTLEDFNAKVNWQIVPSNAFDVWYLRSDKLKQGRSGGLTRPQETTWNQTTPQNTWKIQDNQIVGSSFFFSAQYNGANGAFTLDPQGSPLKQTAIDEGGVWHNTYEFFASGRPQRQVKADLSYFFNAGSVGNELKAGFGYLKAGARSSSQWPGTLNCVGCGTTGLFFEGNGQAAQSYSDFFDCTDADGNSIPCAALTRQSNLSIDNKYFSAFFQDAITFDRLTINVGVRWDQQYGNNNPTTILENPTPEFLAAGVLPTVHYPGADKPFTWNDWQPRVGLTYAFGQNRTTVLKASYAQYAEALGTNTTGQVNPTNSPAYLYYPWTDTNGDGIVQPGEVDLSDTANPLGFRGGVDPANQGAVVSSNNFAPGFKAPRTWEIVAGVDHELFPAFAIGAVYTHRKFTDQLYRFPTGLTSADYVVGGTFTGNLPAQFGGGAYSENWYRLAPGIAVPPGYTWTNRNGDFDQTYDGVDLILTKRLSNRWMMRGSFSYNVNKQHNSGNGCVDPTNTVPGQSLDTGNPSTGYTAESCADDVFVSTRSTGSGDKAAVFLNSKWQFNINGMYQLPMNFNIAASVFGRQGYPVVPFRRQAVNGTVKDVVLASSDDLRYDNVFEFDMRLEKLIPITQTANVTISADCFNITNENTVLQRFNRLNRTNTGLIKEIQSPRIFRFGARISF
jgi:Carboxypeptidase regulatory-like domain/TonB-dependent Receptor Plug Domain